MNYHIPLPNIDILLRRSFKTFDWESAVASDFIHECVKYIIAQYRAKGERIDEFVLLVDESVAIQEVLDKGEILDIHQTLRDSLLSRPMFMNDGRQLKVDLVMSG
jgi:hypothetical protein